jgi:hypothetical protein
MRREVLLSIPVLLLGGAVLAACGGGSELAKGPPAVVTLPPPGAEPVEASRPTAAPVSAASCPPDTTDERIGQQDVCVRVVASPEIPAWQPPGGHLDPCATWTSEKGLVECDPNNELAPAAAPAGKRPGSPRGKTSR